jgi:perosamine synthetase
MGELAIRGGRPVVAAGAHVRWPVLGEQDRRAVLAVLDRGVLSGPFAPEVRGLERAFAAFAGTSHAMATNSGTAALHCALAAAGVGPGHEVLVPAFTFVASALSVLHQNAVPVFVDIEPRTLGMDPRLAAAAITGRTRTIMPVHIHGIPCDLEPLLELGRRHGIPVIEDACQAHGALYRGHPVGSFGTAGAFSLQSSKSLACGEGGILVTADEDFWVRACRTRMFGEDFRPGDEAGYRLDRALDGNRAYDSQGMGWMYRTSELSAALAASQLARLPAWNENALQNATRLSARLAQLPGVTPPFVPADTVPAFHKYRVRLDGRALGVDAPAVKVRDAVLKALQAEGVDAVLWQTQPVPAQGLFREKVGYGRRVKDQPGTPWDLGAPVSYDLAQYPETVKLLESSLCLFSHTYPIAPQPLSLVDAYADAFEKVWMRLGEVL